MICLLALMGLSGHSASAQVAFSDEIILYRGERFMPFIDGPLEVSHTSPADLSRQQQRQLPLMKQKMEEVVSLFTTCSLLSPPQGMKAVLTTGIQPPLPSGENKSFTGNLFLELYVTMVCNEKPCWDKKTDATLKMNINDPSRLAAMHVMDDIWISPRLVSDFFGHPVYRLNDGHREISVITKKNVPLYLPVSRENFILSLINHFEKTISAGESQAASPESETIILVSNPTDKERRKKAFDKDYENLNRFDPLLAKKLNDNYLEAERRLEQAKSDTAAAFTMANFIRMQQLVWQEGIRKLRAELNAMSPLERRSQAHWSESEALNTSGLTPPGHPGSFPLVRINPDILDHSLPATAIQLLTVEWGIETEPYITFKHGRNLQYHKLHQLHECKEIWEAIPGLLTEE